MSSASITSSSGPLDVQGLVSQLMTVAQRPLTQLQTRSSNYNSQISAYGMVSSDLTALQNSLTSLSSGQFINTYQATSSDSKVLTATASGSTSSGLYNVTVNNLATAQNLAFSGLASASTSLGNTAEKMRFSFKNGSTSDVSIPANASLEDVSNAINSAGIGVSASVVKADTSSSPYRLVLTGNTVGAGNAFSTSVVSGQSALSFLSFDASSAMDASGSITDHRLTAQAQDASLSVNGLAMQESSNTVTDAINGVSMSLTQAGSSSLTIAPDTHAIQSNVQGFVTAFNQLQGDVTLLSASQGKLQGDYSLVELQNTLDGILNSPISGANGSTRVAYLAQVGVSLQKDGTLSLDTTSLNHAIASDPTGVANVFGNSNNDGFAQRFNSHINELLGPTGLVTARSNMLNTQLKDIKNQQSQVQTQLATQQQSYLTLYTKLNSSLAAMEQTSSSIMSMLSAVP